MFTNLIMLVAALLMAFSKTAKSFEMILAGRFLYGVGTGMHSRPCGGSVPVFTGIAILG